jgi:hypothetical protein
MLEQLRFITFDRKNNVMSLHSMAIEFVDNPSERQKIFDQRALTIRTFSMFVQYLKETSDNPRHNHRSHDRRIVAVRAPPALLSTGNIFYNADTLARFQSFHQTQTSQDGCISWLTSSETIGCSRRAISFYDSQSEKPVEGKCYFR